MQTNNETRPQSKEVWRGHQSLAHYQAARRRATDRALPTGLFLVSRRDKAPELPAKPTAEDIREIIRDQQTQPTIGRMLLLVALAGLTWLVGISLLLDAWR